MAKSTKRPRRLGCDGSSTRSDTDANSIINGLEEETMMKVMKVAIFGLVIVLSSSALTYAAEDPTCKKILQVWPETIAKSETMGKDYVRCINQIRNIETYPGRTDAACEIEYTLLVSAQDILQKQVSYWWDNCKTQSDKEKADGAN